ncbi:MAG: hypothetical protein F6K11_12095 [Leptolyngbya sp. SIO3F4]|nr:hypothetical protein [Leptolyngbya sp. SIO3F4]
MNSLAITSDTIANAYGIINPILLNTPQSVGLLITGISAPVFTNQNVLVIFPLGQSKIHINRRIRSRDDSPRRISGLFHFLHP